MVNMRIVKVVSGAEYRMDEQFQNSIIFGNSDSLPNWKNSDSLLFF